MRKIVMSGLVAVAALLGCAGPALAGAGAAGATKAVAPAGSAASRIVASYLDRLTAARPQASASTMDVTEGTAISCGSQTACLSVGVHMTGSSSLSSETPFAARLHAGTWKAVPVKTPGGAKFTLPTGVSCKAATYCLVLGEALMNSAGFVPFALAWNGTTLAPIAAPPLPAHTFGLVTFVSCAAVNRCVAVGSGTSETSGATSEIVWTWNGTKWTRTVLPGTDPNTITQFAALHCFSLTSCTAIGDVQHIAGNTNTDTPVAMAWDGSTFTDLRAPLPAGVSRPQFIGLSCVSARSCAVVGTGSTSSTGTGTLALAEVWNGKTWTVTKWGGPKGDNQAGLSGVSCTSAVRCIAVGGHGKAKAGAPAALAWTGSKWTVLKVAGPGAARAAWFNDISCPVNGKCVTTGGAGNASGSTGSPIAGYWNGSAWKYGPMLPAA